MKKLTVFIAVSIIAALLILSGCRSKALPDDTEAKTDEITEPETLNEENKEIAETEHTVVKITDRTVTEGLPTLDTLEGFHTDDKNHYYFGSIKSHYVIVKYSDGSENPLKKALYLGDITVADLDKYGIGYNYISNEEYMEQTGTEAPMKVVYEIVYDTNGNDLCDAEEVFYENSDYIYVFPNPISQYITVRYTDGSDENVMDAFEHSKLVPHDLIAAGIPVWEKSKIDGSSTFYSEGQVYYHE